MDCSLGGSGPRSRSIPKKNLGRSASSLGAVKLLFWLKEDAAPYSGSLADHQQPRGTAIKKRIESKIREAGVFSRSHLSRGRLCSFCAARFLSFAILALPPPSFLEQGKSDRRGSSSLVWEMEEPWICFECQGRRHRKECSSHGCVKGSARFPASFCVKCRAKKPVSPFNVYRCHHVVGPRDRRSCSLWAPAV